MKIKLLSAVLLGALGLAQVASAQDYDDRWYLTGGGGIKFTDRDRAVSDDPMWALGFGKFISPNFSLDLQLDGSSHGNGMILLGDDSDWSMTGLSLVGRYHFWRDEDRNWWPYLAFGAGAQTHDEDYYGVIDQDGTNFIGTIGSGVQIEFEKWSARGEIGMRYDADDGSIAAPFDDSFTDGYALVTAIIPLGAKAAPPPAPEPVPEKTCADLDDDGDGINNCNDKCPGSVAGQAIGPDGCPVPLTIDLRGVNFDFDKDTLRPDAVAILDEAVSILSKYPDLRVEVAGHTDAIGTDAYNQGLSERRAKVVYEYLTGHGIDAGRLLGPNGFGESKPIDSNDTREGRARNRRTELNVQN